MTAHAMKGDREQCLAAGMDGYVSKPIRAEELHQAIARCRAGCRSPKFRRRCQPSTPPALGARPAALNKDEVLSRFNGDAGLLREIIDVFLEVSPTLLAELRAAASRQDLVVFKTNGPHHEGARWATSASRRPWSGPGHSKVDKSRSTGRRSKPTARRWTRPSSD